jgi:hypothetical protein
MKWADARTERSDTNVGTRVAFRDNQQTTRHRGGGGAFDGHKFHACFRVFDDVRHERVGTFL